MIDNFNNKNIFYNFMIINNFEKYIPKKVFNIYPSIAKPFIGMSGKNIYILKNEEDYNIYKNRITNKYIIQEYIQSFISNRVHLLFKDGEYIHGIVYEIHHLYEYYIDNGRLNNYIRRELTEEEKNVFSQICKKNNYHGLCCIDYTYDINNNIKIFEINPRLGGSLVTKKNDFKLFITKIIEHNIIYTS
jgi:glutathione synthase/RimK-type ligase-like ATP-grasp enzyme